MTININNTATVGRAGTRHIVKDSRDMLCGTPAGANIRYRYYSDQGMTATCKRCLAIATRLNDADKNAGKNVEQRNAIIETISNAVLAFDASAKTFGAQETFRNAVIDALAPARQTRKEGWNKEAQHVVSHLMSPQSWRTGDSNSVSTYLRWFIVQEMVYLNYQV